MDILPDNISMLLAFTIAFLFVYTAVLNIYFIHKNGFHVSVNCWFCNRNSKVLYSDRNSFECPFCFQYNGFSKEGGYNKVIAAQHSISTNVTYATPSKSSSPKFHSNNGLCDSCNRNQELKILQLANYDPLDERNYDKEIQHFEQQLEKSYGLCKRCSKTLKRTIRKQNAWIFGNKLKKNLKYRKVPVAQMRRRVNVSSFILLFLSLVTLSGFWSFDTLIPETFLSSGNVILPMNIYKTVYNYIRSTFGPKSIVKCLPKALSLEKSITLFVSLIGVLVECFSNLRLLKEDNIFLKLSHLISWLILAIISVTPYNSDVALYFYTLHLFCSMFLSYAYGSTLVEFSTKQFQFKRHHKADNSVLIEDESDSDDLNVTKLSYKTAYTKHSPIRASFPQSNNTDIHRHFNDLNIGALNGAKTNKSSFVNNPFLSPTPSNKPQFSRFSPQSSNFRSMSPMSLRSEPFYSQNNLNNSFQSAVFPQNSMDYSLLSSRSQNLEHSTLFPQRDTLPQSFSPRSVQEEAMSNHSFRPLSPPRNLVSPPKLNLNAAWPQRFTVNSMQFLGSPEAASEGLLKLIGGGNSRSSSSSSGFVSNGDFVRYSSKSLPNSRNHSPERNSLLSEPVYS